MVLGKGYLWKMMPSDYQIVCLNLLTKKGIFIVELHFSHFVSFARNDTYSSPNTTQVIKSRRMRWAGHVACMWESRGAYRILVGRPEGRRPLGRLRRRWEDNFKMDIQEVGWGHGLD
jgi:hypothetical protein